MSTCRAGLAGVALVLCATVVSGQTSSITGRVANPEGGVIPNAEITLQVPMPAMAGMRQPAPPARTARSRPDGSFTLEQVPPGTYILQIDAEGFGRSSHESTV